MAVSYDASMSHHLPVAEGWLLCSFQIVSKVRKFVIGLMGSYSIGRPTSVEMSHCVNSLLDIFNDESSFSITDHTSGTAILCRHSEKCHKRTSTRYRMPRIQAGFDGYMIITHQVVIEEVCRLIKAQWRRRGFPPSRKA